MKKAVKVKLEELWEAGINTTLGSLTKIKAPGFDFNCKEICPLEKCVFDVVTRKKIEELEERLQKTVVVQCPIFLWDMKD